ncbi:MAG: response regulator [Myxococcales bacterium]|nr:response regulator [Myxococcales bacterium]
MRVCFGTVVSTQSTILLVEDNELNRDMLSRRLSRQGYRVLCAVDGEEGLAVARRDLPQVVLLDLSLPKIDGWEVARVLKADGGTSGIHIIALTAHAMAEDRRRALAAGCDDYETKPIEMGRLLKKIEEALRKGKGA